MPSSCSAPGCKSNYRRRDRIPIFKRPEYPPQLKQAWTQAIHRVDIEELKVVYVCIKHFLEGDIEFNHKVPRGDGTYTEIPRISPKLKQGTVPCLFPGRPPCYISPSITTSNRLFYDSGQSSQNSPEGQLKQKFLHNTMQDLVAHQLLLVREFLTRFD